MIDSYLPILITFVFAGILVGAMLLIAQKLGPKRSNPVKDEPFEAGNPPQGDARGRFSVKFYLVAILFLIFDVEVVFLYPWVIVFRDLGLYGLWAMGIFLLLLVVGFLYEWRKGALEWE